jgi:hypothetical protein
VIAAGALIEGTVTGDDPVCFYNWDATGHCRQFDVVAASDGVIVATLTWTGTFSRAALRPRRIPGSAGRRVGICAGCLAEKHVTIRARSGVT